MEQQVLAAGAWRDWAKGRQPVVAPPPIAGLTLTRWRATDPQMEQPPLDHHLIAIHLGGPKRVFRKSGRHVAIAEMNVGDFSTVEAGQAYCWRTEGPISFAHLFVCPERFAGGVGRMFDRDPAKIAMPDLLGRQDPLVPQLVRMMFAGAAEPDWRLVIDQAFEPLLARIGAAGLGLSPPKSGRAPLPGARVRRVRDFVRANLAESIGLDDLSNVAACSPFHFIRSFHAATGFTPYAFVLNERIAAAMELLAERDMPLAQIGRTVGFARPAQFSARFKSIAGIAPSAYRRCVRGDLGQKPLTSWTI